MLYHHIATFLVLIIPSLTEANPVPRPKTWCGSWAGSLRSHDNPWFALLPNLDDGTRRMFVEPQLMEVPFGPIGGSEPKVQLPKFWGTSKSRRMHCVYT